MQNQSSLNVNPELLNYTRHSHGMLPETVYQELWKLSFLTKGGTYIEVGTAHGAATIALALGAKDAGHNVRIYTIDRMGGKFSSRSKFGSPEDNQKIVEENFKFANVEDCICLFLGSTDEFVARNQAIAGINLLMLDADGQIDRDIAYFYERLEPEAPIIIDDTDNNVYLGKTYNGIPFIDLKHKITSLLLEALIAENYLILDRTIHATAFCRKGKKEMNRDKFQQLAISCYRELVFCSLESNEWNEIIMLMERKSEINQALKIKEAIPPLLLRIGRIMRRLRII